MALTVQFKKEGGIDVYNRKFDPNTGVSVYGKSTTVTGLINPGTHVRFELIKNNQSILVKETLTDLWGGYDFWFRTPEQIGKYNIKITATYPVSGQDVSIIPIGIGLNPDPIPKPESEFSILSFLPVAALALIGVIVYKKAIE